MVVDFSNLAKKYQPSMRRDLGTNLLNSKLVGTTSKQRDMYILDPAVSLFCEYLFV